MQTAWVARETNRRRFRMVAEQLAKDFAGYASRMPDPEVTQDTLAVAHAVRSMGGQAPSERPVNLGRLSNEELRKHLLDTYRINSGF